MGEAGLFTNTIEAAACATCTFITPWWQVTQLEILKTISYEILFKKAD